MRAVGGDGQDGYATTHVRDNGHPEYTAAACFRHGDLLANKAVVPGPSPRRAIPSE